MEMKLQKAAIAAGLVFLAVVSIALLGARFTSQETYTETIASLDSKVETVLKLTATSTVASAGISAMPGDTATPIADKLADFTEYFLLILCVLYAEKYLLTIIGGAAFYILIPLVCGLCIIAMFWNPKLLHRLAFKLTLFALALFVAIPLSVRVSDMVYETYQASIERTISEAEDFTDKANAITEANTNNILEAVMSRLSETAVSLSNKAAKVTNNFVETLAVMIVTSCIIPILVLLFFIWLIKVLTGLEINLPKKHRKANFEQEQSAPSQS